MNAMNDSTNSAEAPHSGTATTARGARRKRATAVAGIATALVLAGAGTALAAGGGPHTSHPSQTSHPSHTSRPAATAAHKTTADGNVTTVQYGDIPIQLAGFSLDMARAELVDKAQLKIGTVTKASPRGCKPTSVLAVSPHAPTVVHKGDTVDLTICAA